MNNRRNNQILKAYRLLFSQESSIDFIKSLNIKNIKSAYRARALETHPDRAKLLGVNERLLTLKFNEICEAYKDLYEFINCSMIPAASLKNRYTYRPSSGTGNKSRTGQQYRYTGKTQESSYSEKKKRRSSDQKERGKKNPFPGRKKEKNQEPVWRSKKDIAKKFRPLFGQYLFFSGYITFSSLLDAIFWQRKQRDLYGKIALKWGIIEKDDILAILKGRKPLEKFGDCACRLGYINKFQHKAILFKQSKMQEQLGEYFVQKGMISRKELQRILQEYKKYQMKN